MSTILSLSITFLDDLFHGQGDDGPEWPPSPHRLYQAILCAASRNGCCNDDVFRWFETLEPPQIIAPPMTRAQRREFFVPNNDADVSKKLERQNRLTGKVAIPTRILGGSTTIRYLWSIRSEDQTLAQKIIEHARLISAVGWGIDLAVADGLIVAEEDPRWSVGMQRWVPASHGSTLRCPTRGTLEDLREVYDSFMNRIDGKYIQLPRRPSVFREAAYRTTGIDSPLRHCACFKLIRPDPEDERFASFDPRRVVHVAAWVRGLACGLAKPEKAGFVKGYDSGQYVAGHVPPEAKNGPSPPRFSYMPLPSIGNEHADGRIRRFIISEPYGSQGECLKWARENLHLQTLTENGGAEKAQMLRIKSDAIKSDAVVQCYTRHERPARVFKTVTPVILTGHDDRNYKKTEKLLLKAVEQAGILTSDVEDLYLQKAPFFPGAFHPRDYVLPGHIKNNPHAAIHVRITWKKPIHGPLALGAGRFCGLGLFAAIGDD